MSKKTLLIVKKLAKQENQDKVEVFLIKLEQKLKREIDVLERNIKNAKYNLDTDMATINERLEDAKEAVEDKYLDITVDSLSTNASRNQFMDTYLENIVTKKEEVCAIEREAEELKEKYQVDIDQDNEEIKIRKEFLVKITETA